MSYGADFDDMYRTAATYIDKILKGAHPADLPIDQASRYEMTINMKTATILGLAIPVAVMARATVLFE